MSRSDTANCGWVLDLLAVVAKELGSGDKVGAAISKAIVEAGGGEIVKAAAPAAPKPAAPPKPTPPKKGR